MNPSPKISGSVKMLLRRAHPAEPWELVWPKGVQHAAFTTITHDELTRLGLYETLRRRSGSINVTLTIIETITGDHNGRNGIDRQRSAGGTTAAADG